MILSIGKLVAKRAEISPGKEAFVEHHRDLRLTFRQQDLRANRTANMLTHLGVQKGDRVAILMANSAEYMDLYYALAKLGAVCVPLNWRLAVPELAFILSDCTACTLVYDGDFDEVVTALLQPVHQLTGLNIFIRNVGAGNIAAPAHDLRTLCRQASDNSPEVAGCDDDPLFIMYTSGTTGRPKGVVHSHKTMMWALITLAATMEVSKDDRFITGMPMFHVGSSSIIMLGLYIGMTIISVREFDPADYWRQIEAERATATMLVPAMMNAMTQVPEKESCSHASLRWAMAGSAPVPVPLIETYEAMGIDVQQVYGLTETCGPACMITGEEAKRRVGSAGKGFLHTEIRVIDDQGRDAEAGAVGEIIVAGDHLMAGYWNNPEATADAIRCGWLHTGDAARIDEDGFIYIVDRIKDMIISGGENIYPAEIEEIMMSHPAVIEAGVIGRADEKWGEVPVAYVVRADDELSSVDILAYLDGKIARYKMPKEVIFVDSLPRTPSGKIMKRVLRKTDIS